MHSKVVAEASIFAYESEIIKQLNCEKNSQTSQRSACRRAGKARFIITSKFIVIN